MTQVYTLILAAFMAFHLATAKSRGHTLFSPLTMFYFGLAQVWILQASSMGDVVELLYGGPTISSAYFLLLLSVMLVAFGYEASPLFFQFKKNAGLRWYDENTVRRLAIVLILAGIAINVLSILQSGGLAAWDEGANKRDINVDNAWLRLLDFLLPIGVVFLLSTSKPFGRYWWIALAIGSATLLFYLYSGTRSRSLVLGFSLLGAMSISTGRKVPLAALLGGFLFAGVVSQFLEEKRSSFALGSLDTLASEFAEFVFRIGVQNGASDVEGESVLARLEYGNEYVLSIATVALVPEVVPYSPDALNELFTRAVPAAWWPEGKPYPYYEAATPLFVAANASGNWVTSGRQPILTGPALGFVAHYYFVGGALALLLFSFLTGLGFRLITDLAGPTAKLGAALALNLAPIGFNEALATPLFWLFSSPAFILAILVAIVSRRKSAILAQPR